MSSLLYFLLFLLLPVMSGCNNEDDITAIFNGKSWKLARLTDEGSGDAFYSDLWSSDAEREKSLEALSQSGFTVQTTCVEDDGVMTGTLSAQGILAYISNASLTIDGKSRSFLVNGTISGSESDPLAIAFLNGLLNVYKYEGDSHNLTLYFKEGNKTRIIGLVVR